MAYVDVRDMAAAHVEALKKVEAARHRIVVSAGIHSLFYCVWKFEFTGTNPGCTTWQDIRMYSIGAHDFIRTYDF